MNKISIQTIHNAHVLVHISHTFYTTEEKKIAYEKASYTQNNKVLDFLKNFFFLNHRETFQRILRQKGKRRKKFSFAIFFPIAIEIVFFLLRERLFYILNFIA